MLGFFSLGQLIRKRLMKKGFVIAISIGFVVFFLVGRELQWFGSSNSESFPKLPDSPQFVPSTDFDGE